MTDQIPSLEFVPAPFKQLVCVPCCYAPLNLNDHLRRHHHISKPEREAVITAHQHYETSSSDQIIYPRHPVAAISCLGDPKTCYMCDRVDCRFLSPSKDKTRQHANTCHGWRSSSSSPTFWHEVQAQRLFNQAQNSKYFVVDTAAINVPASGPSSRPQPSHPHSPITQSSRSSATTALPLLTREGQRISDRLKLEWSQTQQQHEVEMQILDEDIPKQDRTGWWTFTQWPTHFSKCNLVHMAHASRLPDYEERVLQDVVKITDLVLNRAVAGLDTLHREYRRWLRSPKSEELDVRPLARLQEPSSQQRYHKYWRRFTCYCFRVWLSRREVAARESEDGVEVDIEQLFDTDQDPATSTEDSSSGDDSDDDDDDDSESISDTDDGSDSSPERTTSPAPRTRVGRRETREVDTMKDARRLFQWTQPQLDAMETLYNLLLADHDMDEGARNALLTTRLIELYRTFICCHFTSSEFESGLVHFCAVLGIHENRLRRASDYSYLLAGMVYCTRVLGAELLLPSDQRPTQADERIRSQFLWTRKQYLADGTFTPFSTMVSWLAYGKNIAMNTGNAGAVSWSKDKKLLYFHSATIDVALFQKMVVDVVTRAEDILWQKLMWRSDRSDRFEIALHDIIEDINNDKRGFSFTSRTENGLHDRGEWMRDHALNQTGRNRLYDTNAGRWRIHEVRRWLRRCDDCAELMLMGTHTTAGQPARGTEITTIRHRNGSYQDRNVFVIDGVVTIVTRYHKSQALLDRPKVIPRFLPARMGQVMAIYLAYVQPFREYLQVQVLGSDFSDYIWYGHQGPWDTLRLTRILQRETGRVLGHRFGTLEYRHIAVSIGRLVVSSRFAEGYQDNVGEVEEPEVVDEESGLDIQAGRSEVTGQLRYGVRSDIVQHLSAQSLEKFRALSEAWHRFLGLAAPEVEVDERSRFARTSFGISSKRTALAEHEEAEQRGRSRSRRDTPQWRRLFQNAPASPTPAPAASSSPSLRHSSSVVHRRSCSPGLGYREADGHRPSPLELDEARATTMLKTFMKDDNAAFRSPQQRDAMLAILRGETPLVVVLPTGGGKTLLAMLPSHIDPEGVTVFVAPLRALVDNLVLRFRQAGLETVEWRPGHRSPARIVVVSVDFAADFGFVSYCQSLARTGVLRAIFFDEIHCAFTDNHFRSVFDQLQALRSLPCLQVFLTATLPPTKVLVLERNLALRLVRYIRSSTIRPQHRYTVSRCQPKDLISAAVRLAQQRAAHLEQKEKGVIYSLSRSLCQQLATQLQCPYYHAGKVEREEILTEWLQEGGLIVATSALGTGVDFPSIVFTLHVDLPRTMITFAQESGRAGRAGQTVDATIVVPERKAELKIVEGAMSDDESAMAHFVATRHCRRSIMSHFLDGPELARTCRDLDGAAHCDGCGEGVSLLWEKRRKAAEQWLQVRHYLDSLALACALCCGQSKVPAAFEHDVHHCPGVISGECGVDLDAFRRQVEYEPSSHTCHKCGISQRYCATGEDVTAPCQWPNVFIPFLVGTMICEGNRDKLKRAGYMKPLVTRQEQAAFARWLGMRHEQQIWECWMSNGMAVLIQMLSNFSLDEELGEA